MGMTARSAVSHDVTAIARIYNEGIDLGRFVHLAQFEERASEAGTSAGGGIAGESAPPIGTNGRRIPHRKR